jgi:putative salt-induced outer membrane protein YdiY
VLVLLFASASSAWADEVTLANGDRLSGTVIGMDDGQLTIKTPYAANPIVLDWDQVDNLVTDEQVTVVLSDATTLVGATKPAEAGKMRVKMGTIVETASFDLDQVAAINPEPEDASKVKLTARANVGISIKRGNTETGSQHVDAEVVARTETNRYTAGLEFNREKNEDDLTARNYLGYAKYDHFLTEKWYLYANTLFEKDEFQDLRLRSTLGAGAGYQFFESRLMNLSVEAGPAFISEDFEDAPDEDQLAARWAVNFDRYLFDERVQLFHFQEGYQGLEETDDLYIRTRTGVRVPLGRGFNATAQYNYDWDKSPAKGIEEVDRAYLFTLGYVYGE